MPGQRAVLEQRWRHLQRTMAESGLDGLLVAGRGVLASYGYVVWVAGYTPMIRTSYALLGTSGEPTVWLPSDGDVALARERAELTDLRSTGELTGAPTGPPLAQAVAEEIAARELRHVGVVGLSSIMPTADAQTLRAALPATQLSDATALAQHAKELKTREEIDASSRAIELALRAYAAAPELLRPGARAQDVVARIEQVLRQGGATELLVFVEAGPFVPRRVNDAVLDEGDLVTVLVEVADRHGYWVELGGLFALGTPSDAARNLAEASYEALDAVRGAATPGTPVSELVSLVERVATGRGVEVQLGLGHGVGIDHDLPTLSAASTELVKEGHLLSVHPGIWDPELQVATMVADAFWVEADGATRLTSLPYETTVLG